MFIWVSYACLKYKENKKIAMQVSKFKLSETWHLCLDGNQVKLKTTCFIIVESHFWVLITSVTLNHFCNHVTIVTRGSRRCYIVPRKRGIVIFIFSYREFHVCCGIYNRGWRVAQWSNVGTTCCWEAGINSWSCQTRG